MNYKPIKSYPDDVSPGRLDDDEIDDLIFNYTTNALVGELIDTRQRLHYLTVERNSWRELYYRVRFWWKGN